MSTEAKACCVCAKVGPTSRPHLVCSRCKSSIYCSPECQKADWATHKVACTPPTQVPPSEGPTPPMIDGRVANYSIKFKIYPGEIEDPAVWRTLSIPADISFRTLHLAMQEAFDWASTHTYEFEVLDQHGEALLRIEDDEEVTGYRIDAMWKMFEGLNGKPPAKTMKASRTKLYEILQNEQYKCRLCLGFKLILAKSIIYGYDLGDYWKHHFTVLGVVKGTQTIVCTDGAGHGIAEDAGNVPGWTTVLDAYRATKPTKEQRDRRKWYENRCANGDPKGLLNGGEYRWDKAAVNRALATIRIR